MSKKVLVPIYVELRIENRNFHADRSRMSKDNAKSVFDLDRGQATRQPVVHRWHDCIVEHVGLGEALRAAGALVGGAGLQSPQTATTISVREGKRHVQDGPYADDGISRRLRHH
jgi:hypothetical protein